MGILLYPNDPESVSVAAYHLPEKYCVDALGNEREKDTAIVSGSSPGRHSPSILKSVSRARPVAVKCWTSPSAEEGSKDIEIIPEVGHWADVGM
jgi:hypothetical protein